MGRIWLQLWTGDTLPLCKAHASNGPRGCPKYRARVLQVQKPERCDMPEVLVAELGFNSGVSGFYVEPRVCQ